MRREMAPQIKQEKRRQFREPTNDYEKELFNRKIVEVNLEKGILDIDLEEGKLIIANFIIEGDESEKNLLGTEVTKVEIEKNQIDATITFSNGIKLHTTTDKFNASSASMWDD